MMDIRNAVIIFSLKEFDAMYSIPGLPLTHQTIHDLLWVKIFMNNICINKKTMNNILRKLISV